MKPSISKETQDYLKSLEGKADEPDFYYDRLDAIDRLVYEDGLRIKNLHLDKELDLFLLILNNRKIIKRSISDFDRLKNASARELANFENHGTGIHWPELDEDLSLRGFLNYELAHFKEEAV